MLGGLTLLPLGDGASAGCIGPSLDLRQLGDEAVARGDVVQVHGVGFFDGCDDTGGGEGNDGAFGCGTTPDRPLNPPLDDVRLVLRQGPHAWALDTADAGPPAGNISWTAPIPTGLQPGAAVLEAGTARLRISIS